MFRYAPRAALLTALFCFGAHAQGVGGDPCVQPAGDAEPLTPEWVARDTQNLLCAEQRLQDIPLSWAAGLDGAEMPSPTRDPYRAPSRHDGQRFRFDEATPRNRSDETLPAEIYRPCTAATCSEPADSVALAEPPYPTVVVVHGGASQKELHRWATQALAEAGYMAVAFDVASGDHGADAQDIVDWLFSDTFPFPNALDRDRVGIAGHSQGGSTASLLGQLDSRLKAIVAWDNLTAISPELWQDDIGVPPPAEPRIDTPALGIGADYYFVPTPNLAPPEPPPFNGEGGRGRGTQPHPKDLGFQEVRDAGVDTMLYVLRAGTHLDFTPLQAGTGSRYGKPVSLYLTLAWFDRYLRGLDDPELARDAHRRLLATHFDASADRHSIGAGRLDPVEGNQPFMIEGLSLCDRLSFYFTSQYAIRAPGSAEVTESDDWKRDCGVHTPVSALESGGGGLGVLSLLALLMLCLARGWAATVSRVVQCGVGTRPAAAEGAE